MTLAIYSGSFDPPTLGHLDIIRRSLKIFDSLIIAIGVNHEKRSMFSGTEREQLLAGAIADDDELASLSSRIQIIQTDKLLAEFANEQQANAIIRGARSVGEFEAENTMALLNLQLTGIETVLIPANPALSYISSSRIKEIAAFGGDISPFVPPSVADAIAAKS